MDLVQEMIWKLQRAWRRLRNQGEYAAARELGMTIKQLEQARNLWAEAYKATANEIEKRRSEREFGAGAEAIEKTDRSFSLMEKENLNNKMNNDTIENESEGDSVLNTILSKVRVSKVKMKIFPSYDKSKSDTNELSTRWAHRNDVDTGAQAIAFHKDRCYIIEKFDDTDLKYIIQGRINYQDYQNIRKELEENARTEKGKSAAELVVIYDQRNRSGNLNERGRQSSDGSTVEYRRKNDGIQRMAEDQNRGREVDDNIGRSDEQNGGNRESKSLNSDSNIYFSLEENKSYTDQEYRDYGWARENGILTADQNADYRSKFAMAKSGQMKFPRSKQGEYIIPVSDIYDSGKEGINNVLVFANGTIDRPVITSIIEIYEYDETSLDEKRRYICACERRGIQPEIGNVFERYNAVDFQDKRQRSVYESDGDSSDNGYGGRSSRETSEVERGVGEQDYSLMDDVEVSPKKTKELLETIAYLKGQFETTKFAKADPKKLKTMTRKFLKEYSSSLDLDKTTDAMGELYRYMAKKESRYPSGNLGQNQLNTAPPTSMISIAQIISHSQLDNAFCKKKAPMRVLFVFLTIAPVHSPCGDILSNH